MKDFAFAGAQTSGLPKHSRSTYAVAALIHILLFAVLIHIRTQPARVHSAGSLFGSMVAYVPGPIGAAASSSVKPAEPKKTVLATKVATAAPKSDESAAGTSSGSAGVAGGQAGSGPVRLGTGGNLTLIRKVQPIYPALMQSARMAGQVVLDAIIHPDGTIGDITVLSSTNGAFAQSAIAAVKQWQYTAPGVEGILTVTVNFTLNG